MTKLYLLLKEIRQSKLTSQAEMAYQLGISQAYYSKLERGEVDIKVSLIYKIAELFEINASELLKLAELQEIQAKNG